MDKLMGHLITDRKGELIFVPVIEGEWIEIEDYQTKELLNEFITFAKTEYGLTVEAVRSDSFEKIF